ncbi:MAG: polysaccharide biosynthesis protein [Holosporaceae bacterium]|nr:polysaccharide biosynthesis protein [Holosporaceae bacterium]
MDFSFKKTVSDVFSKKIGKTFENCYKKSKAYVRKIPREYIVHIKNVSVIAASYGLAALLVYGGFGLRIFLRELFSLLCAYGAVCIWFTARISRETPFRIAVGVTSCIAPILFINNSVVTALVCLLTIILCEFIFFEYLRGCNLFSGRLPVYIICENENDAKYAEAFQKEYKILELAVLSAQKKEIYGSLESLEDIRKRLDRINRFPFYPSPRRLIYLAKKTNPDVLAELSELAADCSVPAFRATKNIFADEENGITSCGVAPISYDDWGTSGGVSSEKTVFSSVLRGKRIWVCYDGRGCVRDLIGMIASVSSANLTVLCESERLMAETERDLSERYPDKDCKIKIADINLLELQGGKPDILFYNMPIRHAGSGEENLKEAVVKNVSDTGKLIKFAQSVKIPTVFILSASGALNVNNWIGATQRLGELYAQFADSQSRRTYTKFKIIRLPEEMTDPAGIFGKTVSSIVSNGCINLNPADFESETPYHRKDISDPFLKIIAALIKNGDTEPYVYTVAPKNGISPDELAKNICRMYHLRKDKDVRIIRDSRSREMTLDDFLSITESPEKTPIAGVLRTAFPCVNSKKYESMWTLEEINAMSTRELISAVFQSLNEKIKT